MDLHGIDFKPINNLKKIKYLNISGNNTTDLYDIDFTNFSELTHFTANNTSESIIKRIQNNKELEVLELRNCCIDDITGISTLAILVH